MVECEYYKFNLNDIRSIGFNRYMVECEYISTELLRNLLQVLIDTWWNVNDVFLTVT